ELARTSLEHVVDPLADAAPLEVGMDAHPLDLGDTVGQRPDSAHADDPSRLRRDDELAAVAQVSVLDVPQVVLPGTVAAVSIRSVHDQVVQLPDGVVVAGPVAAELGHQVDQIRPFSMIVRAIAIPDRTDNTAKT